MSDGGGAVSIRSLEAQEAAEKHVASPTIHDQLFEAQERASVLFNTVRDAVISVDELGTVTEINAVAATLTGWHQQEAIGEPLCFVLQLLDGRTRSVASDPAGKAMRNGIKKPRAERSFLLTRAGDEIAIEHYAACVCDARSRVVGAIVVFHDVKYSQSVTDRLAHLATHDPLTDLLNRTALMERFDFAVAMARRHHRQVALLFIDLDDFKRVNDTLGHDAGDRLLVSVARTLVSCVRRTDAVCRFGGDEFVVLLNEIGRLNRPERVADKLRRAVTSTNLIEGLSQPVRLSIGISVYPDDGLEMDTLIRTADEAMYAGKCGESAPGNKRPSGSMLARVLNRIAPGL